MRTASVITLDDVAGAYAATGLKPNAGNVDPHDGRCCAIGALLAAAGMKLWTELGLEHVADFAMGFDSGLRGDKHAERRGFTILEWDAYSRGYEIGKAMQ